MAILYCWQLTYSNGDQVSLAATGKITRYSSESDSVSVAGIERRAATSNEQFSNAEPMTCTCSHCRSDVVYK
jgi:hypothetical protein